MFHRSPLLVALVFLIPLLGACVSGGSFGPSDPDEPGIVDPAEALCPSVPGLTTNRVVAWSWGDDNINFIHADSSIEAGPRFFDSERFPTPKDTMRRASEVLAHGDFLAVSARYSRPWPDVDPASEYLLFNRDGLLQWRFADEGSHPAQIFLGDDGWLVANRGWDNELGVARDALLFKADGERINMAGFYPIGAPHPIAGGAAVPACHQPENERCGWWHSTDNSFRESTNDMNMWRKQIMGDMVYLGVSDDGYAMVVRADGSSESSILLPGAFLWGGMDHTPFLELLSADNTTGRLVLGHNGWNHEQRVSWVVDLVQGSAEFVNLQFPIGLWRIEPEYCPPQAAHVDSAGRMYVPLRSESSAATYVAEPPYVDWTQVGDPVTQVIDLVTQSYGDTLLLSANSGMDTFCMRLEWAEAGPGTLVGDSHQLLLDSAGVHEIWQPDADFSMPTPILSPGGECVAVLDWNSEELEIRDLASATTRSLAIKWGGWLLP